MMHSIFSYHQVNNIILSYNQGKTQNEIAKELNCSQKTISSILIKNKITTRIPKNITYNDININFFNLINSEENAYFLGLLYADGCVQIKNTQYVMTIKLKKEDIIIIEKLRDILSPSSPVKLYDGKYSYFRTHQKIICDQLIDLGCVPNKSLKLIFPSFIKPELVRHFIRGYSDGDGTIYKNKLRHGINFIWKIISTDKFCNSVKEIINKTLNVNCSLSLSCPKTNQITTTLSVGGNRQSKKLLDWLYSDATIYLPRKYEKYQEFNRYISSSKSMSESKSDTSKLSSISNSNKSSAG